QRRDFRICVSFQRPLVEAAVPAIGRFAEGEIVELIDVVTLLRIAQEVVQEGSKPCVPRFGVGGEPDDRTHSRFRVMGEERFGRYISVSADSLKREREGPAQ